LGKCLLRAVNLKNDRSKPNFGVSTFFRGKSGGLFFYKKWVGPHFGRSFSQTHPVTLPSTPLLHDVPAATSFLLNVAGRGKKKS
jgi:hypothetical protein